MKLRTAIKKISAKRLAANGGVVPFSTISSPKKAIRKRPRKKAEFARIYGSKERVELVKSLPCAACGVVGYSENAHVPPTAESGGAGRKADYRFIVPLCGPHPTSLNRAGLTAGHHWILDKLLGRARFEAEYCVNFDQLAADTEKRWLAHSGGKE